MSDAIIGVVVQFLINTACLYLGLKLAGVKKANLGKVFFVNLIGSLIIPKFVEFILDIAGILLGEVASMIIGFFVVVLIIQAMFDEEFQRAFLATLLAYGLYFGILWLMRKV